MSNQRLNVTQSEVKFDKDGNLIITNRELIARVKKAMDGSIENVPRGGYVCDIDVFCE